MEVIPSSFQTEEERKSSLKNWPCKTIQKKKVLLSGLFYYEEDDLLKCFDCGAVFGDWEEGDDPIEAHRFLVPECEYIQKIAKLEAPQAKTGKPPHNDFMSIISSRIKSFEDWPPSIPVSVFQLADAGFYYSGIGDRVDCFYCGGKLKDWKSTDDPWKEHAKWFPGCHYLGIVKGQDFITSVVEDKEEPVQPKPTKLISKVLSEECIKCESSKKNTCLYPCGHLLTCEDCAIWLIKCPDESCARYVHDFYRVYNC